MPKKNPEYFMQYRWDHGQNAVTPCIVAMEMEKLSYTKYVS
jgi:hypothetical protein